MLLAEYSRGIVLRAVFLKRFSVALGITAPLALLFLKAPMGEGPHAASSPHRTANAASYLNLPSATEAKSSDKESAFLSQAFTSRTSQLLWSEALPIAYEGADTVENVRLAAEAIDLATIQPGETFSFNDMVGIRTEDKGYRPGLMYSQGQLVMGIGGGICIASTQIYKAALESGFEIAERHPHSGRVSYADPGRDAAVSFGWADMRFKNDSDSLVIIRSVVQDDTLVVALYGKKTPGRTVVITSEDYDEIPYRVIETADETIPSGEQVVEQKGRTGFAVTTVRLIRQNGKLVKREVISRDVVFPCNKTIRLHPGESSIPTMPAIRVPIELPKMESLPLPRVEGTIRIPEDPQSDSGGLPLERPDSRDTSERTDATASE